MPKQEIPLLNLSLCVSVREYRGQGEGVKFYNQKILYPKNDDSLFNLCAKITVPSAAPLHRSKKSAKNR